MQHLFQPRWQELRTRCGGVHAMASVKKKIKCVMCRPHGAVGAITTISPWTWVENLGLWARDVVWKGVPAALLWRISACFRTQAGSGFRPAGRSSESLFTATFTLPPSSDALRTNVLAYKTYRTRRRIENKGCVTSMRPPLVPHSVARGWRSDALEPTATCGRV